MKLGERLQNAGRRVMSFFNVRNMAILMAVLLLLCLVPMFAVSAYNHPIGDDYGYGRSAHEAWEETRSVFAVLAAACRRTAEVYRTWQGTFSAMFLMALQPGIWGEQFYGWGTVILLGSFLLASALFLWVALKKTLRMDGWSILMVGSLYALLSTQFLPMAMPAFYWFNGGVYYTFFYSLSLVYASLILLRCLHGKRSAACAVPILLLSVVIGGGNYVTFLLSAVLLLALIVYQFAVKRPDWVVCAALLLLVAAFFVSFLAPGTAVRAGNLPERRFLRTVGVTFLYVGKFFAEHVTLPVILAVLFSAPALMRNAATSGRDFRFPLLVTLGSFALLYVGFFPAIYTMSGGVPERLLNILFYMLVLLLFVNLYYYLGWLSRVLGGPADDAPFMRLVRRLRPYVGYYYLSVGLLTLIACCSMSMLKTSAVQATLDIVSGDAAQYDREMNERLDLLRATEDMDVVVPTLGAVPAAFGSELSEDPAYWINILYAEYWGKNSVTIS